MKHVKKVLLFLDKDETSGAFLQQHYDDTTSGGIHFAAPEDSVSAAAHGIVEIRGRNEAVSLDLEDSLSGQEGSVNSGNIFLNSAEDTSLIILVFAKLFLFHKSFAGKPKKPRVYIVHTPLPFPPLSFIFYVLLVSLS